MHEEHKSEHALDAVLSDMKKSNVHKTQIVNFYLKFPF